MAPSPLTHRALALSDISPLISRHILQTRDDTTTHTAGQGTISVTSIPNTVIFVLFGLIGAGLICTAIWFFFWVPNGGFVFQEGDWEDYKSTVLRRKGPNGTTLSGASESTDLGGGSIVGRKHRAKYEKARYKDLDLESSTGTHSEMAEVKSARKSKKDKKGNKSRKDQSEKVPLHIDDDNATVYSEQPSEAIRNYRHERPARVGGLNSVPEGSDAEEGLLAARQTTPKSTPTKRPTISKGLRAVQPSIYHGKKHEAEAEAKRIKSEAKKLQDKGRAASKNRRDFSYAARGYRGEDEESQVGLTAPSTVASSVAGDNAEDRRARRARRQSRSPEKKVPGSWTGDSEAGSVVGSDVSGTKSYHHPIPGLDDYAEDRRKARRDRNL